MRPDKPLPYADGAFASADDYVDQLLRFVTTTPVFQVLCGGVHIMDFYTTDPGHFYAVVPPAWQAFLLACEPMALLDFLLRDDLDAWEAAATDETPGETPDAARPPPSLVQYVRDVRRFSLQRTFQPARAPPRLPHKITTGMNVKKRHEVTQFAAYVDQLADTVAGAADGGAPITHILDVGSGQNYLGRALASAPYGRRVVAVEGRGHNIAGAKGLDVLTGVVAAPAGARPRRNKKLYQQRLQATQPPAKQSAKVRNRLAREGDDDAAAADRPEGDAADADFRPLNEIAAEWYEKRRQGGGGDGGGDGDADAGDDNGDNDRIQYIEGRLENGDLTEVLAQVRPLAPGAGAAAAAPSLLAVSIHSCGNLSHYGLRALLLNPAVRAVAIVGCCYNLLTERLGPPTYKLPGMAAAARPTLQPVNGRVVREAERRDPEGFPMSARMATYRAAGADPAAAAAAAGVRFNITARMMACQAPQNWTAADSARFFTRHVYRAVLQRIFLDRGVIQRVRWGGEGEAKGQEGEAKGQEGEAKGQEGEAKGQEGEAKGTEGQNHAHGEGEGEDQGPSVLSTAVRPIIVGSLRKACYSSLAAYVRGAVAKLTSEGEGGGEDDGDGDDTNDTNVNNSSSVRRDVAAKMAGLTDEALAAYAQQFGARRQRELSAVWSLMAFSAGVVESAIVADRWLFLREAVAAGAVRDCWVESVFAYEQSPRNLVVVGVR